MFILKSNLEYIVPYLLSLFTFYWSLITHYSFTTTIL